MTFFTPNMPLDTQSLNDTRQFVQDNFTTINTALTVDHFPMNNPNAGKHNFAHFVAQVLSTVNENEIGIFCDSANSNRLTLQTILKNAQTKYAISGPVFSGQGTLTQGGTSALFGGIQIKWGVASYTGNGTAQPFTFAAESGSAFPTKLGFIKVEIAAAQSLTASSNTGFSLKAGTVAPEQFTFIAIGY